MEKIILIVLILFCTIATAQDCKSFPMWNLVFHMEQSVIDVGKSYQPKDYIMIYEGGGQPGISNFTMSTVLNKLIQLL